MDDALLAAVAQAAPQLQRLRLAHCIAVTDEGVCALAAQCPGLLELCLDDCIKVGLGLRGSRSGRGALPAGGPAAHVNRRSAAFTGTRGCCVPPLAQVTSQGVTALARHCKQLQALSLRHCSKVEDAALAELARNGTLRRLGLNSMPQLRGECLEALAACCRHQLEEVDASWCRGIAWQYFGRLADGCPGLQRLELWGCTHVGDQFLHGHSNDGLRVLGRGERLVAVS